MSLTKTLWLGILLLLSPCLLQAEEPAKTTVKIGYLPITDHLLLGVAKERAKNNFQSFSLDTMRFTDWATIAEGMRSGSLNGAFLLAPLAFQLQLAKAPVKVVLLGHRNGSTLIVKSRETLNTAQDLKDTRIAIPHRYSTHNFLLHKYTADAKLEYGKDFKVIEMPPPEMVAALSINTIDGYIVAEPFGARGELSGAGKILTLSANIWQHHPDCVLVMQEAFIQKNPNVVQELVENLVQAGVFVEEHRADAAKIGAVFLKQPEDAMLKTLTDPKERVTFYDLLPKADELTLMQDYMTDKMKLFTSKASINTLLDLRFAQKAYQTIGTQIREREYLPR